MFGKLHSPYPSHPLLLSLFHILPYFSHLPNQCLLEVFYSDDMSDALDRIAPEDRKGNLYRHSAEGLDDMPAHIKSALIGASVSVPITNGKLATGTWQGIWFLEFRASKHQRKVVATIQGEKA